MSEIPRFVVIDGDPVDKAEPIKHMGTPGLVVDRETKLAYGFGAGVAAMAAAEFNAGTITPDEVWNGEPLKLVGEEFAQLGAVEKGYSS
jgi:hypothetical protein